MRESAFEDASRPKRETMGRKKQSRRATFSGVRLSMDSTNKGFTLLLQHFGYCYFIACVTTQERKILQADVSLGTPRRTRTFDLVNEIILIMISQQSSISSWVVLFFFSCSLMLFADNVSRAVLQNEVWIKITIVYFITLKVNQAFASIVYFSVLRESIRAEVTHCDSAGLSVFPHAI